MQEESAINKILFLDKRADSVKTSGTLVSSGPDGEWIFVGGVGTAVACEATAVPTF